MLQFAMLVGKVQTWSYLNANFWSENSSAYETSCYHNFHFISTIQSKNKNRFFFVLRLSRISKNPISEEFVLHLLKYLFTVFNTYFISFQNYLWRSITGYNFSLILIDKMLDRMCNAWLIPNLNFLTISQNIKKD